MQYNYIVYFLKYNAFLLQFNLFLLLLHRKVSKLVSNNQINLEKNENTTEKT